MILMRSYNCGEEREKEGVRWTRHIIEVCEVHVGLHVAFGLYFFGFRSKLYWLCGQFCLKSQINRPRSQKIISCYTLIWNIGVVKEATRNK